MAWLIFLSDDVTVEVIFFPPIAFRTRCVAAFLSSTTNRLAAPEISYCCWRIQQSAAASTGSKAWLQSWFGFDNQKKLPVETAADGPIAFRTRCVAAFLSSTTNRLAAPEISYCCWRMGRSAAASTGSKAWLQSWFGFDNQKKLPVETAADGSSWPSVDPSAAVSTGSFFWLSNPNQLCNQALLPVLQRRPIRQQQYDISGAASRFVVEDKNAATHLVRNATEKD
jgi:hypothetical protein